FHKGLLSLFLRVPTLAFKCLTEQPLDTKNCRANVIGHARHVNAVDSFAKPLKAGPVAMASELAWRIEDVEAVVCGPDLFDSAKERSVSGLIGAGVAVELFCPAALLPVRVFAALD